MPNGMALKPRLDVEMLLAIVPTLIVSSVVSI